MADIVLEHYGEPLTHQKIVPGNTATGTSDKCYKYSQWQYTYTGGGTTVPVVGGWIVGATSSARARILKIGTLSGGSWGAGTAAGTMYVHSVSGTFNGIENISVGATADDMTMSSVLTPYNSTVTDYDGFIGREAKAALVCVYANTALVTLDGSTPDQTSLIGVPMVANSSILMMDINQIRKFMCIDYTSGSASVVQITYFF